MSANGSLEVSSALNACKTSTDAASATKATNASETTGTATAESSATSKSASEATTATEASGVATISTEATKATTSSTAKATKRSKGTKAAAIAASNAVVANRATLVVATIAIGAEGCVTLGESAEVANFGVATETNWCTLSAVLGTVVGVLKLVVVSVAASNTSNSLHVGGVSSSVGNLAAVIVVLVAEIIVVGTVVPGTEVVSPATISMILFVLISVGVLAWGVAERVSSEANNVANISRGVLVALIADTSFLLTVVLVVVTVHRVEGDINFARVVAPLVVDGLLGIPVIVGAPLVPGVVNPLVMALTLMATSSLGVVGIDSSAVIATLVTVVLVIGTVALNLGVEVLFPGLNCNHRSGEKDRSEHCF